MARHPKPENANNVLKKLREALGTGGVPIPQHELGRILGLSPETIKSVEAGRRRQGDLSPAITRKIFLYAGACWDEKRKQWEPLFELKVPYSRKHYEAWKHPRHNKEQEIHALCLKLVVLLQSANDHNFRIVCDHIEFFFEECVQTFGIKVVDPDFQKASRVGAPVDRQGSPTRNHEKIAGYKWERPGLFAAGKTKLFDFTHKLSATPKNRQ